MTLEQLQALGITPSSVETAFVPDTGPGSLLSQALNSTQSASTSGGASSSVTPEMLSLISRQQQGSQQEDAPSLPPGTLELLKLASTRSQGSQQEDAPSLPPGALELLKSASSRSQGSQQEDAPSLPPGALELISKGKSSQESDAPSITADQLANYLGGKQSSSQPQVVAGPDGKPMVLPPNTGAANAYGGGSPAVQVHVYGGASAAPAASDGTAPESASSSKSAFPDFYSWASQFGYQKGQVVPVAEKIQLQKLYADAQNHHKGDVQPQLIQIPDGPSFIRLGNTMLPVASQKGVSTAEKTLPDGRIMRYVTDSSRPDYLAGEVVYDKNTGQPMITGEPDPTLQLQRMSDQSKLSDIKSQAADLAAKIAAGQKAPWYSSTSYEDQLAGLKAKYEQLQSPGVSIPVSRSASSGSASTAPSSAGRPADALSIRAAYRSGQIDKSTAAAMLRQLQIPSIQ